MSAAFRRFPRAIAMLALPCLVVLASCSGDDAVTPSVPDDSAAYSGGATTIFNGTSQAYTFPAPNLVDLPRHMEGDAAFDAAFVAPPAPVNAGLGPVFNNNACVTCHVSNGRGRPPEPGTEPESMLLRVSVAGTDAQGGPNPAPGFGAQLNDKALFGVAPEALVTVSYTETQHQFADGETYLLRTPAFEISDEYVPLPPGLMISPRVALPVFGRGLLEAIPEADILALADENDSNGDGISGRPNYVYDVLADATVLGRFGWKANQPSLVQQAAAAYRNDMGVTNPVFTTESTEGQTQDDGQADDPEVDMETVAVAAFYTQTLAVPARRRIHDSDVMRGERLFRQAKCAVCHTPAFTTGTLPGVPSVSNQHIQPFSDMLLHDMGDGLADGRPDYLATGSEWRTSPLWGIGLTAVVQGYAFYLHDGRARTLMEAVMWHGGEADASREFVRMLPGRDRAALVAFLESL